MSRSAASPAAAPAGSVMWSVRRLTSNACSFRQAAVRRITISASSVASGSTLASRKTCRWAGFAPTGVIHPGDLSGNYGGVQGNASVGLGVGANALVGGSNNTFALQPVSAEAQTGLNVSTGLADLELRPAVVPGPAPRHSRHRHRH